MTSYEIGLAVHIFGALIFFGGALLVGVVFETARRRGRPSEVALLLGLTRIGALIVVAGAVLVFGAGLWLAGEVDQFREAWLVTSLGLFVAALVLGALGGQRPKHARLLATRLADDGDEMTPELRRLLDDPPSRIANYGSSLLVVVILLLMIWQPGR
ncbi:MAG: DUF2269 family protein [Actinomycetota bacterium]